MNGSEFCALPQSQNNVVFGGQISQTKEYLTYSIRNMYKGSEPMGRLHSVQKHMANVYLPLQFKEVKM